MMTDNHFPGGVWPVMLTPYCENGEVDYKALGALTEWYIANGASGLFAVTQSSEMYFLTLEERVKIAGFVKQQAAGRVPVIAAGHISDDLAMQAEEVTKIGATGVDAVILVTNHLAKQDEDDDIWIANMEKLLAMIPADLKLGLYECPVPYKRLMSDRITEWCAKSGRFYFLKDTCCDLESIRKKLKLCEGSNLKLYNANVTTLLDSVRIGAAGFSGIMANMQCSLYAKLCRDFADEKMDGLSDVLTMCAMMEGRCYPNSAKYYLNKYENVQMTPISRVHDWHGIDDTIKKELQVLKNLTDRLKAEYL